jgi:hypothetical protein
MYDFDAIECTVLEESLHQPRVARIVLDEKDLRRGTLQSQHTPKLAASQAATISELRKNQHTHV